MFISNISLKQLYFPCFTLVSIIFITACGGGSSEETAPPAQNKAPTITISSPGINTVFIENETITLQGTATDEEDGSISANIEWSSNIDGSLGMGATVSSTSLALGEHTITASVVDSGSLSTTTTTSLIVSTAAGTATVSWNAPSQNIDNTALTDLAGFYVYYGLSVNNLDQKSPLITTSSNRSVINQLRTHTTYYFAVSAVNTFQVESSLSNIVSKVINE